MKHYYIFVFIMPFVMLETLIFYRCPNFVEALARLKFLIGFLSDPYDMVNFSGLSKIF